MKSTLSRGLVCVLAAAALAIASAESLAARPVVVPIIVHNTARPEITITDHPGWYGSSGLARAEAASVTGLLVTRDGLLAGAAEESALRSLTESALDGDLLTLDVPESRIVDAWLETRLDHGSRYFSGVPLIDESMIEGAGSVVSIYSLDRGASSLRIINFGAAAATCTAASESGGSAAFAAEPGRQVAFDAFVTSGPREALRVSCDQRFYAFATVFDPADGRLAVVAPSSFPPVRARAEAGLPPLTLVYERLGLVHAPSKDCSKKKGFVKMALEETTSFERVVGVIDILIGPWNKKNPGGVHSPWWHHRDNKAQPFRSNSIINANFGGTKGFLKYNTNLDQPKGHIFKAEGFVKVGKGDEIQLQVIHSAADKEASLTLFNADGETVKVVNGKASGFNHQLLIKGGEGSLLELGHFCGQHAPEVAWEFGTQFSNFQAEFFIKETK